MTARRPLRRAAAAVALLLLAGAAGCSGPADETPDREPAMTAAVDDVPAQLMAADRRFAADVAAARGADRARIWAAWFAPGGRQLVPAQVVSGQEDIADLMAPAFADTGFALSWEPDLADGAGTWGWTSGRYVSTRPGPGGPDGPDGPDRREGRYLTVWERQPDGAWKVAVDAGVPDGG